MDGIGYAPPRTASLRSRTFLHAPRPPRYPATNTNLQITSTLYSVCQINAVRIPVYLLHNLYIFQTLTSILLRINSYNCSLSLSTTRHTYSYGFSYRNVTTKLKKVFLEICTYRNRVATTDIR